MDVSKQKHLKQFKFLAQNIDSVVRKLADDLVNEDLGPRIQKLSEQLNLGVGSEHMKKAMKKYKRTGDLGASEVTMSQYSPSRYLGSVSENFALAREKVRYTSPCGRGTEIYS